MPRSALDPARAAQPAASAGRDYQATLRPPLDLDQALRLAHGVSGPAPRPLLRAPNPGPTSGQVLWPSVEWLAHYSTCALGRRCRHRFVFPTWWLAMNQRGKPMHPDAEAALQMAVNMVNGYQGHPQLLPEPLRFTQQAVLDSLVLAPAPIGYSWMRCTLSSVAGLARWCDATGQPLTREHVFNEEVRYRYANKCKQQATGSSPNASARARLELVAAFFNGTGHTEDLGDPTGDEPAPVEPLSEEEEADLWVWSLGVRPVQRHERMQAVLALGLGCGLNAGETNRVMAADVSRDSDGVHVTIIGRKGIPRVVTCRVEWEDRLWRLVETTPAGRNLASPWRDTPSSKATASEMVRRALKKNAPALFNGTRLRNTWLCRHLQAGTDLKVLMAAAGMQEANHLHNLLVWVPDAEPVAAARSLRFNTHTQIRDAHESLLRLADEQTAPDENPGHGYPMRGVRE